MRPGAFAGQGRQVAVDDHGPVQLVAAELGRVKGVGAVDAPAGSKVGERPEVGELVCDVDQFELFGLGQDLGLGSDGAVFGGKVGGHRRQSNSHDSTASHA